MSIIVDNLSGFDAYQGIASKTRANDLDSDLEIAVLALGLTGESGETADIIKKMVGHKHPFTEETGEAIISELGDVLWYISQIADWFGFDLSDVAAYNMDKLRKRYPDGFSTERSVNR